MLSVLQCSVDGDLCEQFNSLDYTKRKVIAEELDRTPAEVRSNFMCGVPQGKSGLRQNVNVKFQVQNVPEI